MWTFGRVTLAHIVLVIVTLLTLASGAALASTPLRLTPESLAQRQLQTRRFTGIEEGEILRACAGILQDLGFTLDDSEPPLGLLVASKQASAAQRWQVTAAWLLAWFDVDIDIAERQLIRVSLVTRPDPSAPDAYLVRVTFQRIVWNDDGEVIRTEALVDPALYVEFFDKLSKSVFLEGQAL